MPTVIIIIITGRKTDIIESMYRQVLKPATETRCYCKARVPATASNPHPHPHLKNTIYLRWKMRHLRIKGSAGAYGDQFLENIACDHHKVARSEPEKGQTMFHSPGDIKPSLHTIHLFNKLC